jgi:hypothetical protein
MKNIELEPSRAIPDLTSSASPLTGRRNLSNRQLAPACKALGLEAIGWHSGIRCDALDSVGTPLGAIPEAGLATMPSAPWCPIEKEILPRRACGGCRWLESVLSASSVAAIESAWGATSRPASDMSWQPPSLQAGSLPALVRACPRNRPRRVRRAKLTSQKSIHAALGGKRRRRTA